MGLSQLIYVYVRASNCRFITYELVTQLVSPLGIMANRWVTAASSPFYR